MKEKMLLIGGGGHCKSVIDVIESDNRFEIAGVIDKKDMVGKNVLGYKIIGCDDDLEELFKTYKFAMVTIGQIEPNLLRVKLFKKLIGIGYKLPIIISPFAYVSKYVKIGNGTVVMHQALLNADVSIGENCIINTKALIEHDAVIGDNCHISTAAVINGGAKVEENTFFGSNATAKEAIRISGFVKAGSLVK